jgi:sialidase-1
MTSIMSIVSISLALCGAPAEEGRWIHPLCKLNDVDRNAPFVAAADGSLLSIDAKGFRTSKDDGKTWSEPVPVCEGLKPEEPAVSYLMQTRGGTLVVVYLNFTDSKFEWDEKVGEPKDCKLEMWAIRSLDGGKTWIDNQRILDGQNTNFFGFIQTPKGRIVASAGHLVSNPGRWVVGSLHSDDEGKTWKHSNWIDLGGHGHHDGATEPAMAELSDGRLMMLVRTNLDRFWQAFSDDGGRYWRTIQPSTIDASSSPGMLLRLKSGRLALCWNRMNPEGGVSPKITLEMHFEIPASLFRQELSLAFSEDDGKTWTKPMVIAREQRGGQLSYPYMFERRPGELWIAPCIAQKVEWKTPNAPLRFRAREDELLKAAKKGGQ